MWGCFELFFSIKCFPNSNLFERTRNERTFVGTDERMNARKRTSYEEKRKNGANTTMNFYTAIASYILRGKVFQTLHVSSVLSAGGQVGFSELLGHRRLVF